MKNSDHHYEGHLDMREFSVPAGREWSSPLSGWSVTKVGTGTGYYLLQQVSQELETGSVILVPDGVKGSIRASQLGELSSYAFSVKLARLTGLISLVEQRQLEMAAAKRKDAVQIFSPTSPAAEKMEALRACKKREGLQFRLKLLQFFVELIGDELEQPMPEEANSDARQRLQLFLKETPSSELLEMNFNEMAQRTHCTSRHLGRIFQELVGMSFRDKRAEIRLEKARELLATTDCKIADVAMESGFKSLSLFNLLFARHFGVSPGKWRQELEASGKIKAPEKAKSFSLSPGAFISVEPNAMARSSLNSEKLSPKKTRNPLGATVMTKGFSRFLRQSAIASR